MMGINLIEMAATSFVKLKKDISALMSITNNLIA